MSQDRDYAIIIAFDGYNNDLEPLQGAINDAKNFYNWVIDDVNGGSVPEENVTTLWDEQGKFDDYATVNDTLRQVLGLDQLENREERRRRLYIFFAGHGITVNAPIGVRQSDTTAVLARECNPNMLEFGYHFAACIIWEALEKIRTYDEAFLIMDCCRDIDSTVRPNDFWGIDLKGSGDAPKIFTLFAAEVGHASRERPIDGKTQGLFTTSLINNLRYSHNSDGKVTFKSLSDGIYNDFPEERGQSPVLQSPSTQDDEIVICRPQEILLGSIKVNFGHYAGQRGTVLFHSGDNFEQEENLETITEEYTVTDLDYGLYTIAISLDASNRPVIRNTAITATERNPHVQFN